MAGHTGIFATSSEILTKAGTNYNSTFVTEAKINELCLQAESIINSMSRYNWTDAYTAGLNADVKYILSSLESSWVAMRVISADMSGYTSIQEATTMLDLLRDEFMTNMKQLKDKKAELFVTGA